VNPTPHVLQHAVASLATTLAVLGLCGSPAALPAAIVASVTVLLWLAFSLPYRLRLRRQGDRRSAFRRGEDRVMARCGLIGLVAPSVFAWAVWAIHTPEPLLDGVDAALGGSLAVAIPLSIVVSGGVDWYLILPFVRGVFGAPVCRGNDHDTTALRAYDKYWIVHRWTTELICYTSLALVVAIGLNAVGRSGDAIAGAVASLSAGGILAYAAPRLRYAWHYFLGENAGLGTWARGRDASCDWIEGVVVDLSLYKGVKLLEGPAAKPCFVPLSNVDTLTEIPSRPSVCSGEKCGGWLNHCEIRERASDRAPSADH
jgi:hypothetical protein